MLSHNLITTRNLIAVCPLLLFMGTRTGAEDRLMVPTPVPAPTIQPFVPTREKLFYEPSTTVIPGTRHWVIWKDGGLMHFNTTQSVGDGSAMYVYLPAGAKSGWLTAYDTGVQPVKDKNGQVTRDDLREYKGLCLWIKGDGSDAVAVFTTNSGYSKNKFRVPLKDTNWHKVFMPWDKWRESITGHWWFLTYGLERSDQGKDNWYILDRVHLYKDEKTEPIQPTPNIDPPGMVPAKAFVSGREHIARTLAKLKAKQPVKIVVAGDSIVTCAQLWYIRDDYTKPASDTYPYAYWWVLGQRLRDAYGYEKVGCMLRTWDDKEKKWTDTVTQRPKAELQVFAVATGGWTAKLGLEHLDQVLAEKPDLVIWEYGGNEGINGSLDQYVKCTEEAVGKLRAAGCEVVIQSMTTSADLYPKDWLKDKSIYEYLGELSKHSRRIAKEKNCALADMYAALSCRGIQFVGDLHSDFVHLNHYGHEMFADVLDALLTDRDVRIWRYGPAAKKAKAAQMAGKTDAPVVLVANREIVTAGDPFVGEYVGTFHPVGVQGGKPRPEDGKDFKPQKCGTCHTEATIEHSGAEYRLTMVVDHGNDKDGKLKKERIALKAERHAETLCFSNADYSITLAGGEVTGTRTGRMAAEIKLKRKPAARP